MKIKAKLLIAFVLLLIIPGAIISYFGYQNTNNSVEELTKKGLQGNVQVALELIEAQHKAVEAGFISEEEAQEQVKEQLIGPKNADGTRELTDKFELGEHGYFVIFDAEGNTLGHPTIEGTNVWDEQYDGIYFIQEMINQARQGDGFTYYSFPMPNNPDSIREKITYTEEAAHWGWIVGVNLYEHEYSTSSDYLFITTVVTLLVTVIVGMLFGNFFANHVSRPLGMIVNQANAIANGDLSIEKLSFRRSDEIHILATAMNTMSNNLRKLIREVHDASNMVGSGSDDLAQSAQEVMGGSEQVTATMEELSTATETEANLASELADSMVVFGTKMDAVNDSGRKLRQGFSDVIELTDSGQETMDISVAQMESINKIVQASVKDVQDLESESKKISELVSVIQGISEQTNLLALNAAIEAARAGEHGAGFAVVADEVRNLAEEVAVSVTDITEIVSGIQAETSSVTSALEEGYKEVELGTSNIAETGAIFVDIRQAVHEMVRNIEEATHNLFDITKESEQMNKMISEIAAISEESAAGIEETTASAQEANSSVAEITSKLNDLVKLSRELTELVERFNL